jgi:hypothetical protein
MEIGRRGPGRVQVPACGHHNERGGLDTASVESTEPREEADGTARHGFSEGEERVAQACRGDAGGDQALDPAADDDVRDHDVDLVAANQGDGVVPDSPIGRHRQEGG